MNNLNSGIVATRQRSPRIPEEECLSRAIWQRVSIPVGCVHPFPPSAHLLMPLEAWEPTLPDLFYPCDLVAASSSAMTLQRPPSLSTPSNPGSLTSPACLTNLHEHPGSCPSAAPAKPPRHSSTSTSTSSASSRDRARLRRATSASIASAGCLHTHSSPGHTPELELWDVGDFVLDAGSSRTPLGVLYHSCSLWELVSLASAVAWLLVCLAA